MRRVLMAALFLSSAACAMRGLDLEAWDKASAEVRASVESYQAMNTSPMTGTQCSEHLAAYVKEVRPRLEHMRELGRMMDGCFHDMEHHDDADVEHHCALMEDELSRYASAGCGSQEPAQNQATANAHCSRMLEQLAATDARGGDMHGMMGPGMMPSCRP